MAITREGLTLEEFLALPEEKPALEYADGVVTQKVAPQYEHSLLQARLLLLLEQRLGPARLARALPELRTTYAGRSTVPDLVVFRRERLPRRTRGARVGDVRVPPDLAIEIISPGEPFDQLAAKCAWYVAHGVAVALLVDDRAETVHVFRPGAPSQAVRRGERIALDAVAPGLALDPAEVFAVLDSD